MILKKSIHEKLLLNQKFDAKLDLDFILIKSYIF
jgi:hypothetical protein